MGGSRHSVLFKKIRGELNLAYSIGTDFVLNPISGYFQIYLSISPDNVKKSIEAIKGEILRVVEEGIDKTIFERSKNFIKYQKILSFDSTSGSASSLSSYLFWDNLYMTPSKFSQYVDSITTDEIIDFVKLFLTNREPLLGILKPKDI